MLCSEPDLWFPATKYMMGWRPEELENEETNADCAVIVPEMNKETRPCLYMIATKQIRTQMRWNLVVQLWN